MPSGSETRPKQPQLYARSRAAWRKWLQANHRKREVVFLVFYRKALGKPCVTYDEAVREALCFGWIDGVKNKLDDERYSYRFTPRRKGSNWSDSNKKRVAELTESGLMRAAGLAAVEAAQSSGTWAKQARSPTPKRMPKELAAALRASPGARRAYDALAPSHRTNYQRWVADAKKPETRERRAAKAVTMLLAGKGGL